MKPNDYTVLATSQEGQDTVPDTSGNGRPIGSNGRGYTVLAEGVDVDNYQGEPKEQDQIGLADVLMDTFHMAGSTNQDGSTDFFGGSDANERLGAGIQEASGFSGRIKPEYRSEDSEPDTNGGRVRQVIGETGKGVSDLINGGFIGMDATVADLINFFDGDNSVADHYRGLAQERTNNANYPEGAATAVGQEAGAMAIAAPIGGKATDLVLGSGKMVGNVIKKRVGKLASKGEANIVKNVDRINNTSKSQLKDIETLRTVAPNLSDDLTIQANKLNKQRVKDVGDAMSPKPPSLNLVSEAVGLISPSTKKLIDTLYDRAGSIVSSRAAVQVKRRFEKELRDKGYQDDVIARVWRSITNKSNSKTAVDSLIKSPNKAGSAVGALMGNQ